MCRDSVARVFRIPTHGSGKSHIYQSRSHSVIRPRDFAVPRVGTAGRYFGLSRVCRDSVVWVFRIPKDGSDKSHIYQSGSYSVIRPRGLAVPRGGTTGPLCRIVSADLEHWRTPSCNDAVTAAPSLPRQRSVAAVPADVTAFLRKARNRLFANCLFAKCAECAHTALIAKFALATDV